MITLSGTLHINSQSTLLHCSLGRFVLNDIRFVDIPTGKHDGFFEIQKIEATVIQKSQGQVQLGLLAILKGFSVKTVVTQNATVTGSVNRLNPQLSLLEADDFSPVDADMQATALEAVGPDTELPVPAVPSIEIAGVAVSTETQQDTMQEEVILPDTVELDATLPRDQIRQKIQQLQKQGYRFEKDRQLWQRVA